ncbi:MULTISPECIES: glycosyltransferase family 2 protein [Rufibacter]|uniref:Glycosyltransferase involved in cell wall biosynthesis n=1 Tax=Rufibacter quisquiliarum TaxID=1549639 RepID=A0A839GYU6_9BACT|nr:MULTISPECIES: glycosyltransferase family 2 protein [Rufibacter]MBA9078831.1 glycosyltransferase involved in cell wall biosynthesis [Rufibacter quisquiliarum]
MPAPISVTILAKNSQEYLPACLSALASFPEIILLDNGSTDDTVAIAQTFANVRVFHSPFIGFGPLKNLAASHATHDWILSVDSDEVLSPELVQNILTHALAPTTVYQFLRKNFYGKREINACGWENDFVLRLYHRQHTGFSQRDVHEGIRTDGVQVRTLPGTLDHFSYRDASELVSKMNYYSSLFAQEHQDRKKSGFLKAVLKGIFSFLKNYFLKKGFLYGADGFVISVTNAAGSFYKYYKLYEANKRLNKNG